MAKEQRIDLIKDVYSKIEYPRVIDTNFNQLGVISVNEQLNLTPTVDDFFKLYNDLFYEIPAFGPSNSHEYLIVTSGEYINYDQDSAIIATLQNEITNLRRELLQAQIEKAEALTGQNFNINLDSIDDNTIASNDFQNILKTIGSPELNTTNSSVVASNPTNANSTVSGPSTF
jgi:hypothetical protein